MRSVEKRRGVSGLLPRVLLLALGACGAALGWSRCFNPELPDCSYICNPKEPRCPDEYSCQADGYCHLKGTTSACPYTMDLSARPDLQSLPDLAPTADLSGRDLATFK